MENKSIWFRKDLLITELTGMMPSTMGSHLGMEWKEIGSDYLKISMPVDDRTRQPYGILHGGASCALAETVGSVASYFVIDHEQFICVGLDINANHVRSVKEGTVTACARPLHLGATTHVWDIKIHDEEDRLVCISRLTVAILKKREHLTNMPTSQP